MWKRALFAMACTFALTASAKPGLGAPAPTIPGAPKASPVSASAPLGAPVQIPAEKPLPAARQGTRVQGAARLAEAVPVPLPSGKTRPGGKTPAPGSAARVAGRSEGAAWGDPREVSRNRSTEPKGKQTGRPARKARPRSGKPGRKNAAKATEEVEPTSGKAPLEELRERAERGDPAAQVELGARYHRGKGVGQDLARARRWYGRAAEQGNAVGQFNLGVLYAFGDGIPKDPGEALKWYLRAAQTGYPSAQFNLGVLYATGEGVTKDGREAARWYRKAAERGFRPAQLNLAMVYHLGEGIQKDEEEAKAWYAKAADGGDVRAQYALGLLARQEGDDAAAVGWYRKAAAQQFAPAQAELASLVAEGLGVPKDPAKAVSLAGAAAADTPLRERRNDETLPDALSARLGPEERERESDQGDRAVATAGAGVAPSFPEPEVMGTGFAIGPDGLLVTSFRLVEEARGKALRVFLPDGQMVEPEIVKTSKARDLAVLKVGVATPDYLEVVRAGEGPKAGDKVFGVAFLASQLKSGAPKVANAVVLASRRSTARGGVFAVGLAGAREKGTAGAPLLDEQGRVVGVLPAPGVAVAPDDAAPASDGRKDWVVGAGELRELLPGLPEPHDPPGANRVQVVTRARRSLCLIVTVPQADEAGKGGPGGKGERPDG